MNMVLAKVPVMWNMGMHDDAVQHYANTLLRLDTLHNSMIEDQQAYLQERDAKQRLQLQSMVIKLWTSRALEWTMLLLLVALIGIVAYALYVFMQLRSNHRVTVQKLTEAQASDKAKEKFLRNMTTLINEPLQIVVGDAKRLSTDATLPPDEQKALIGNSKVHVARLMTLVNNVLDLSRLEACMMKYNIERVNLRQVLDDAMWDAAMQARPVALMVNSEIDEFEIGVDRQRMKNVMKTLCSAPIDHPDMHPEAMNIDLKPTEDGGAMMIITGSPYAEPFEMTEAERMANSINGYLMRDFNATYKVEDGRVVITFAPFQP